MKNVTKQKIDLEQSPNPPELTAGEKFWKELQEMPYNNSRAGQYFVFFSKSLPSERPNKSKKDDAK